MFQEAESSVVIAYLAGSALMFLLIAAIVTYAFLHQKKVIQLRNQLHEEELHRQQAVFDALQEGQEQERTRLAQELHDGVGAKLSGIKMHLEYLSIHSEGHRDLVHKIFTGVSETVEEVREISHNLHPLALDTKGLETLLQDYAEQLGTMGACRYDIRVQLPAGSIDKQLQLHSYRIIEELLNNIHKHARASQASVQVHAEEGILEIVAEDNGIGFDRSGSNAAGIGLRNIENRVHVCKGTLNMDSTEKGTTIIIEIPLNHPT